MVSAQTPAGSGSTAQWLKDLAECRTDTVGLEGHEISQAGPRLKLLPPPLQKHGHLHCPADGSSGKRYLMRRFRTRDTYPGKMMSREILLKLRLLPARSVSPHKHRPRQLPCERSLFSGSLSHFPVLLPRTVLLTSHILTLNGDWFLSRDQICNQIPGPAPRLVLSCQLFSIRSWFR